MIVEIKAVNRDNSRYSNAPSIVLPNIVKARKTVQQTLLCHPFKKDDLYIKPSIIVNVTVGGSDYYSPFSALPWAWIDYKKYLKDRRAPVLLHLHLAKYMGIDDSFAIDIPDTQEIVKRNMNFSVFQSILHHEFSHLIDAIDPNFKYDQYVREQFLEKQCVHKVFIDLWNAYIDRRLSTLLGTDYEKNILVTKDSRKERIDRSLKSIWSNEADYTFLQLMQMAEECCNAL